MTNFNKWLHMYCQPLSIFFFFHFSDLFSNVYPSQLMPINVYPSQLMYLQVQGYRSIRSLHFVFFFLVLNIFQLTLPFNGRSFVSFLYFLFLPFLTHFVCLYTCLNFVPFYNLLEHLNTFSGFF